MTPTTTTEKDPARKKILAAMDRLVDGKPLRSTGRLSVSQLAVEAGVGRWQLTHQHVDLKELFQARVRAVESGAAARELSDYERLKTKHAELVAYCGELEERLRLYAGVINLLALEKEASEGKAPVADLESGRRRRVERNETDPG